MTDRRIVAIAEAVAAGGTTSMELKDYGFMYRHVMNSGIDDLLDMVDQ